MELHQALRHIIQTEGAEILNEQRLLNILVDLNAFSDIQGSKYIMRAIINDGVINQFKAIGMMNLQVNNFIARFISNTGFDAYVAKKIFNSIAFGLGWIEKMPPLSNPSNPPIPNNPQPGGQQPNQPPVPNPIAASLNLTSAKLNRKNPDFVLDYCERACEYLDSIIEFKEDFAKTRGLIVKAYSN